jgi:tungstate transport system substrate-binding protein
MSLNGTLGLAHDSSKLRLASTTSVHNSGLLQQIVEQFERESGYRVEVHALGSGAALRMGREGRADVIISNAPDAEKQFIQEGSGAVRQRIMHNDFVLVGPADDPAEIRGLSYCVAALKRIAAGRHTFASRADQSGTHQRELELWQPTGLKPYGENWYRETGMGMGDTLRLADELQAYVLVDRGTWLAMRSTLTLALFCDSDPRLVNNYSVIAVSRDSSPGVNEGAGRAFVEWITSDRIQALIGSFKADGEVLFVPAKDRP